MEPITGLPLGREDTEPEDSLHNLEDYDHLQGFPERTRITTDSRLNVTPLHP